MDPFFAKLLGGGESVSSGAEIISSDWRTGGGWLLYILALLILGGLAVWLYRTKGIDVSERQRRMLTGLRVALFALLLLPFLKPVLALDLKSQIKGDFLVLLDTSSSMGLPAENPEPGANASTTSRLAAATDSLAADAGVVDDLSERFELEVHTLSGPIAPPTGGESEEEDRRALRQRVRATETAERETALGEQLLQLLGQRSQNPTGVLVVTDGNVNAGASLAQAAEAFRRASIPLHVAGIGHTEVADASIRSISTPGVALVGEKLPLDIRIGNTGLANATADLVILSNGLEISREEIVLNESGSQHVSVEFTPRLPGDYNIEARLEGLPDPVAANDSAQQAIRATDSQLRILMVEEAPRWEYRYLQEMLLREKRVRLDIFLAEADEEVKRAGWPYISRLPSEIDEFMQYDLVILGDISPDILDTTVQEALANYVDRLGGSLMVVAGRRAMPAEYRHSPLARALPVEVRLSLGQGRDRVYSDPLNVSLTPQGQDEAMLDIGQPWTTLPPVFFVATDISPKPSATTLAVAENPAGGAEEPVPLVVTQQYGRGEVIFFGTDNTWRWRRERGDEVYTRLHAQLVQSLAGGRLTQGSRKARVTATKPAYAPGEPIRLQARIFDETGEPETAPTIMAVVRERFDEQRSGDVELTAVPGRPGFYEAAVQAPENEGFFSIYLEGDPLATADVEIRGDRREETEIALREDALRELARSTGGIYVSLAELDELPQRLSGQQRERVHRAEIPLWDSPLFFILILLIASTEWLLRKRWHLK